MMAVADEKWSWLEIMAVVWLLINIYFSIAYLSLLVTSGTFHVNSFIFMRSYLWRIMTGNIWRTQKSEIADDGGSLMATTARHSINLKCQSRIKNAAKLKKPKE